MIKKNQFPYIDRPHIIFPRDILKYGWEKALILGHLSQCLNPDGTLPKTKDLHTFFKVFDKKIFYKLLGELIAEGVLADDEEYSHE
jgi:hypothetical protein